MYQMINTDKRIQLIDKAIFFLLAVLIFVLPIAHTATIRAFAFCIPLALLIVRHLILKDFQWIKTSFEWQFFAFFIAAVFSLPTSTNVHESITEIRSEILIPILLFYLIYYATKKEAEVLFLLKVLFLGSLIFSLYSFFDFFIHNGSFFNPAYRAGGLRDPGGGEVAGLYHTMVIALIFWMFFHARKTLLRFALGSLFFINLFALYITFTRAAYIAVAVQCIMISVMFLLKRKWLGAVAIIVLLSSLFFFFSEKKLLRELHTVELPAIKQYLSMKPEDISTPENTSSTLDRLAMWKTALDEISKNPIYPHGYGRFLFGRTVKTQENRHFIYAQVHNTFIGITYELGVQGLIIFLWIIGSFFYFFYKSWKGSAQTLSHYLSAALLTMMTGYWVNNFFGSFDGDDSKLLFMVLLGAGAATVNKISHSKESRDKEI